MCDSYEGCFWRNQLVLGEQNFANRNDVSGVGQILPRIRRAVTPSHILILIDQYCKNASLAVDEHALPSNWLFKEPFDAKSYDKHT